MIKLGNIFKGGAKPQKLTEVISEKPVYRFGGWQQMGAQVRPKDTRITGELIATIEDMAERNPDIKDFVAGLKTMDPKHLNLASDTIELASSRELTMTPVNMNIINPQKGKSAIQSLLEAYPKASKENPEALDLLQEVINNTDNTTSKYFLSRIVDGLSDTKFRPQLKAVKPLVKDIAEETLKGGYLGTFEKQENFINYLGCFLNSNARPEKITLFPKFDKTVDKIANGNHEIFVSKFVNSNTPISRVEDNIQVMPEVAELFHQNGKSIDLVDFVNNNVNLY